MRPKVVWEYCSDGGNMNTFRMAQLFDTANSVDAGNSYNTRVGSWAHTFPYAPRFAAKCVPFSCGHATAASSSRKVPG